MQRMSKRIWMVGAFSDNFGDRVLQRSNSDLLREYFDCDFTYLNCQKTFFSKNLIKSINKNADMLFFAGGGLIFRRDMDKSVSGWQFNCEIENIKEIKVPIVFNGIGFNRFPYQPDFKPGMWDHLQETINCSALFSVRNSGTLEALKENGINVSKVQITPDCGIFIRTEDYHHSMFDNNLKIGLNWASDRATQRFSGNWANKLMVVLKVLKNTNANVYLIEHLMPNELNVDIKLAMRQMFKEELGERGHVLFDKLHDLYPMFDYNSTLFSDIYKKMDLVLGMRGHSGLISFGLNTPFIGLGQHNKIRFFMEDVGLEHNIVKLNQTDEQDEDELKEKVDRILSNVQEEKCNISNKLAIEKAKKDAWFEKIAGLIK